MSQFGRPRERTEILDKEIRISIDRPATLRLAPFLYELAAGGYKEMSLEPVEQFDTSNDWWGDLESGSPILDIKHEGYTLRFQEVFRHEPPPFQKDYGFPMESDSEIRLGLVEQGVEEPRITLTANSPALLSMTKHLLYLSQPEIPTGTRCVYDDSKGVQNNGLYLVFQMEAFPQNVPWAKPPRS
jgi:hypothetical protein